MDSVKAVKGTILGGWFTVEGEPTTGALPHLVEATHETGRYLLTLMPTAACLSPDAAGALLDAARRAATFTHPRLVPVVDVGDVSVPPGTHFVVEPITVGPTLAAYLSERGFLSLPETVTLVGQLAEALGAAHAAGLVHGELHPRAVQVQGSEAAPEARLHGLGWSEETTAARGTQEASPYRAPEHVGKLRGGDPRADQYSLGVIAYELLAGCLPFSPESADLGDPSALKDRAPTPIAEWVPGVPRAVDQVVGRALSFEPGRRFPSVADFGEALRAVALAAAASEEETEGEAPGPTPAPEPALPARGTAAALPGTTPAKSADGPAARLPGEGATGAQPAAEAHTFESQATVLVADPLALAGAAALGQGGAPRRKTGPGGKKKKGHKKRRAVQIHPSATEFADDDGPTALENPATLVAAHRVLEAGLEARELRDEPPAAPGLTPPRESPMPPGVTPPPARANAEDGAPDSAEGAVTPPPRVALPEALPQTPRPATTPLTPGAPAAPFVAPALATGPAKKPWPLIAAGSLVLGGLVVWMLISLLKRPPRAEDASPETPSSESRSAPTRSP